MMSVIGDRHRDIQRVKRVELKFYERKLSSKDKI